MARHASGGWARIARASGMRILGPNCLGVYNAAIGYFATFTTTLDIHRPEPGPVAIVSQSGAYGSHLGLLARRRRIDVGLWVTTGNECDVTVPECIAWMAARPEIEVVAAYAEGTRDGDALLAALDAARAHGKAVFFLKAGRSEAGAEAVRSHTAALAGADAVFGSVLAQHGIVRTDTTEEMLDAAYAGSFGALPTGRRTGFMTISGGAGVLMADEAAAQGLEVAPMPQATQSRLKERLSFCTRETLSTSPRRYSTRPISSANFSMRCSMKATMRPSSSSSPTSRRSSSWRNPILDALARARERHPHRPILMSMIGSGEAIARYEALNVPVFEDPVRAVRAVSALARVAEGLARGPGAGADTTAPSRRGIATAAAGSTSTRQSGSSRRGASPRWKRASHTAPQRRRAPPRRSARRSR